MKNSILVMSLLSATVFMSPDITIASGIPTHTHTNTPGLKPASSNFVKLASVCFMGYGDCNTNIGYGKGDDYSRPTEEMCREEGFTKTSCIIPEYLYNPCPYNSRFYKECRRDNAKACIDSGYFQTCGAGYIPDASQTCPYDSSYKKCKCDPCSGYDYTYAQATAEGYTAGASCNSCGTIKYQRQNATCNGFLSCDCGADVGAASCKSGTSTLYKSCKSCCTDTCPSGYYKTAGENGRCTFGSSTQKTECGTTCYQCKGPNSGGYYGCAPNCPEGYTYNDATHDYTCNPTTCLQKIKAKYPGYFYGNNAECSDYINQNYKFDRPFVGESSASWFSWDICPFNNSVITQSFYVPADFKDEFKECGSYCAPMFSLSNKTIRGNVYLGIKIPSGYSNSAFKNTTIDGTLTIPGDYAVFEGLTLKENSKLIIDRLRGPLGSVTNVSLKNGTLYSGTSIIVNRYYAYLYDTTIAGNTAGTPVNLENIYLRGNITSAHVLAGTSGGLYLNMKVYAYATDMGKYSINRKPGGKINVTIPIADPNSGMVLFNNPGADTVVTLLKAAGSYSSSNTACLILAKDTSKKLCSSYQSNTTVTFLTDDTSKHVLPTCCSLDSGCAANQWNNGTMKCEGYSRR